MQCQVDGIGLRCRRDRERCLSDPVNRESVSDVRDLVVRVVRIHQGVLLNCVRSGIGTRDARQQAAQRVEPSDRRAHHVGERWVSGAIVLRHCIRRDRDCLTRDDCSRGRIRQCRVVGSHSSIGPVCNVVRDNDIRVGRRVCARVIGARRRHRECLRRDETRHRSDRDCSGGLRPVVLTGRNRRRRDRDGSWRNRIGAVWVIRQRIVAG